MSLQLWGRHSLYFVIPVLTLFLLERFPVLDFLSGLFFSKVVNFVSLMLQK